MQPFEYAAPDTLEEAVGLLSDTWGETEIYAGGTDLVTCLKQRITTPKRVVSLKNVKDLLDPDGGIPGDISRYDSMRPLVRAQSTSNDDGISDVINAINTPQILSQGTFGGDICQRPRCWYFRSGYGLFGEKDGKSLVENGDNRYHAIFGNEGRAKYVNPSSLAPVLIAIGASVEIAGPHPTESGKVQYKSIDCSEFFKIPTDDSERETVLAPNEIVTGFAIPDPIFRHASATYEVRHRNGLDWPYVTASVSLQGPMSDGLRVVLGHVAPVPWVVPEAAEVLKDGVTEASATKAGEIAAEGATPLSRNGYKVAMVKTAVKRAALLAASRA